MIKYYLLDRMRAYVNVCEGEVFFEWYDKDRFDYEMEDYTPTEIAEMVIGNEWFNIDDLQWGFDNDILVSWTEEEFREEIDYIEDEIILKYIKVIDDGELLYEYLELKEEEK